MHHLTRIISLTAAAMLMVLPSASAQFRQNQRSKTRSQLIDENTRLQEQIDSMEMVIHNMNRKRRADSLKAAAAAVESNRGKGPTDFTPERADSLFSIWYEQQMIARSHEGENYDMDNVHFTSTVSDKVLIERLEKMNSYITLPYNETVKNYMILYAEKMPQKMPRILGLSQYYMPIFEEVFNKYGLPEELKVMAVIESALNPVAVSRANAKGMWQFMQNTAKSYGLKINSFVDERFDTYKAADAAARYLRDAYRIFGDWNLAISSYNCGSGNVNKAIRRAGGKTDFWSIYNYLPKETRGYVPAFVGAMYAMTYYKEHGIKPDAIDLPAQTDTFEIKKMVHFKQISELAGIPMQTLQELNPQYIHDVIPGGGDTYILRLPFNYSNAFIAVEDSVYTYKAKEYLEPATLLNGTPGTKVVNNGTMIETRTPYKVKSGDTLGKIASRNHVTVANLKKWNNLKSDNLRIGQTIYIVKLTPAPKKEETVQPEPPKPTTPPATEVKVDSLSVKADSTATSVAAAPADSLASTTPVAEKEVTGQPERGTVQVAPKEPEYIIYTVKSGDTLYKITSRYKGVTADEIMSINGIGTNIKIGQKIKIPKK